MKRRLVKQGDNALTVTIPSSWIKENQLKAKDEIDIEEHDDSLLISTKAKKALKSINLPLKSSNEKYIDATFRNLYINGYDEIQVRFGSEEDLLKVAKAISQLIGYEIVSQKEGECLVKNISSSEDQEYESIFKRIFYTVFLMHELVDNAMNGVYPKTDQGKMDELSKNASKFSCFCRRTLFKSNIYRNEEGLAKYVVINYVHMVARNYAAIYSWVSRSNTSPKKEAQAYSKEVNTLFHLLFEAYCGRDLGKVEDILGRRDEMMRLGFAAAKDAKSFPIIHYNMEIARLCGTIAGKIGFINSLQNKLSVNR